MMSLVCRSVKALCRGEELCAPRGAEVTGERGSSVYDFSINLFARKIGDAPKICFGQKKNDYFPQVNSLFSPGK